MIRGTHVILYVRDQARSAAFYRRALEIEPTLDVPGMTEIPIGEGVVLGLMPEQGIARLLKIDPVAGGRPSRAELYLRVDDAAAYHARALEAGARELSPLGLRDWGERVAYALDLDGHVIAFAERADD